eukprot:4407278-Amphidinium_carterae.1
MGGHPAEGPVRESGVGSGFSILLLALSIKLELPVGRGREAGSQALKVFPGAGHFRTQEQKMNR